MATIHPRLVERLACPRDHSILTDTGDHLECAQHHRYPVVDGVPVMLIEEAPPTHESIQRSLAEASTHVGDLSPDPSSAGIDPVVQEMIAATNGLLYRGLIGGLQRYPIPQLRLPTSSGQVLLDIGCNWGRWSIAATRLGYGAIGIDPDLRAVLAAQRVSRQLGADAAFVVGDARYLPFRDGAFDVVFSYSVLQHFTRSDVRATLAQVRRVLGASGTSLIQMANAFGARSLYHLARRIGHTPGQFEVRYWTPQQLVRTFDACIGPSRLSVDGFFGLGIQASDLDLLPPRYQLVVRASEMLRGWSQRRPWMLNLADSVYIRSVVRPSAARADQ